MFGLRRNRSELLALLCVVVSAANAALPSGPLIIGYQNWGACNLTESFAEASRGVNVIIWFAINLGKNSTTGNALINGGPNYTCMAEVAAALDDAGLETTHLVSVGGWNSPHPDTTWSGEEWFRFWDSWNKELERPFDGFDWDLEGHDSPQALTNEFTPETLDLVIDMSAEAKKHGYIVAMAPAQSYLDPTTDQFSLSLLNAYADFHPDFHYRGLNCYAYLLAAAPEGTFDFITIQLYESWSRASQAIQKGEVPSEYLARAADAYTRGWVVNFSHPNLRRHGPQEIKILPEQLILGFSFGFGNGKSVAFLPSDAREAYMKADSQYRPRGYAFWNIALDNLEHNFNGTTRTVQLSAGLNEFLQVRSGMDSDNVLISGASQTGIGVFIASLVLLVFDMKF